MTGEQLIALGRATMAQSHKLILLGGVLGLLSIFAGVISRRLGAPVLLVFLACDGTSSTSSKAWPGSRRSCCF
jgi:hypothetical protein